MRDQLEQRPWVVEWDHGLFKGKDKEKAHVFRADEGGECGRVVVRVNRNWIR